MRKTVRRTLTWLLVLGVLGGVLAAAHVLLSVPNRGLPGRDAECGGRPVEVRHASIEARVDTANRDYARVTSKLMVRIPADWTGGAALLGHRDDPAYRDVMRCLLAIVPGEQRRHEWRDAPPSVRVDGDELVLTDTASTDVTRRGAFDVGMVLVRVEGTKWVLSTRELAAQVVVRSSEVSITVPRGWLGPAAPWPPGEVSATSVTWRWNDSPTAAARAGHLRQVELHPDRRHSQLVANGSPGGLSLTWSTFWLGALAFVVAALYLLRRRDGAEDARRAVRPLLLVMLVPAVMSGGHLALTRLVNTRYWQWEWIAWGTGLACALVALVAAWRWWVHGAAVVVCGLALGGAFTWLVLMDGPRPYESSTSDGWVAGLVSSSSMQLTISYICAFLLVAGAASAVQRLFALERRWWVWVAGAGGAGVLVAEKWWIAAVNANRHTWLAEWEHPAEVHLLAHRYFPWDLVDDIAWILFALAPLALWAFLLARRDNLSTSDVRWLGIGLFLLGPVEWYLWAWGFQLPAWLVGLVVLRLLVREVEGDTANSAVDVATMTKAAGYGARLALIFAPPLLWLSWTASPLFVAEQQDSILLSHLDALVWEVGKWVVGAMAIGLLWRQLPGTRGPVKVLSVVAAYASVSLTQYGVAWIAGDKADPLALLDAGLFALGMVVLGVLLDRATAGVGWRGLIAEYGVQNWSTRLTLLIGPLAGVLSIVAFFQGGEPPSAPNVDPTELTRVETPRR